MKKLVIATAFCLFVIEANAQYGRNYQNQYPNNQYPSNQYPNNQYPNGGYGNRGYDSRNYGNQIDDFQRQARIRIADGVASGTINSREAKRLLSNAEQIERKEQRFWRDGFLAPHERQELLTDLSVLEQQIWHEKNDRNEYNGEYANNNNYGGGYGRRGDHGRHHRRNE